MAVPFDTWLIWLENTALAATVRQSLWLYPLIQFIHIAGIVLLVGSAMIFDLRLLGCARKLSVLDLGRYLIPWSMIGFVIVIVSGFLLFSAHASDWAENPLFWSKILLILLALTNAGFFNRYIMKKLRGTEIYRKPPSIAYISGALSLALWFLIIAAGRFLAYY